MRIRYPRKSAIKSVGIFVSAFLVAGVGIFLYSYFNSKPASAAWFNESWLYRKALTVTVSSSASDITELETLVTVDTSTAGKFQSSCQDLRFTNQKGDLLPYYIDSGCGTDSTKVWVLADLVPKNTTTYMMYMYYGNPSAPAASDSNKFRLFNGLVGYWAMNESAWAGVAGEVKDSSINGNNGVRAGDATTTSSGKYSYAGTFDGTGDYVDVSSSTINNIPASSYSVSIWFKITSQTTSSSLFSFGQGTATDETDCYIHQPSGNPSCNRISGSVSISQTDTSKNYIDGTWHHFVSVYDNSAKSFTIYTDGVQKGSNSNASFSPAAVNQTWIGELYYGGSALYSMNGQIDDTRIYNRALSAAEISQLYTNPGNIASNVNATVKPTTVAGSEEQSPGPVGYWAFDDGQGQTTQDSSSSGNDGTLGATSGSSTDDPTWQPEDRCIGGKCLYFDGGDYVKVQDNSSLDFGTGQFAVGMWVKFNTLSGTTGLFYKRQYSGDFTGVYAWADSNGALNLSSYDAGAGPIATTANSTVTTNKWYYLVFLRNSSGAFKIYVDGIDKATSSSTTAQDITNGEPLYIGSHVANGTGTPSSFTTGFIDEPKIYPYARTAAQIKTDYNAGKANAGTNSGAGAVLGAQPQDYLSNGLVGYWKMEEAATPSLDSSGNGTSGTWNGNTAAAAGKFGNSASLDGTGDYIDLGTGSTFAITGDITDVVWIKANSDISKWRMVMGKESPSRYPHRIYINKSDVANPGKVNFDFTINSGTGVTVTSTTAVNDNAWHQVVGVRKGSSAYIYVDGVLENSTTFSGTVDAAAGSNMVIGDTLGCSSPTLCGYSFYGTIDEVRIYNRALSPKEISDLYNWAPGPVGYWDFEEGGNIGVGSTAFDRSGNSNPGIWKGTGAKHTDTGKVGKAGKFNGSDDYVDAGDPSSGIFDFGTGDFTISAWVKPNALASGDGIIFKNEGAGNKQYRIRLTDSNGNLQVESYDGTTEREYTSTTNPLSIGKWTHISGVREQNSIKLYANGVLLGSTAGAAVDVSNSANLKIGLGPGSDYFNGTIDDVKIYNYARSAKQIVSDMNAGHPNVGSPVGSAIGHWDFDEGQGTIAHNIGSAGGTLNGTLTSMASPATATSGWTQSGKFGKALNFDGSSDYVSIPYNATWNNNSVTFSAWINPTNFTNPMNVFDRDDESGGNRIMQFQTQTNGSIQLILTTTNAAWDIDITTPASSLTAGQWQQVVGTYNSTTGQGAVYINGVSKGTDTATGSMASSTTLGYYIGRHQKALNPTNFLGSIDEPKIYNYALTSDEVKTEYNKGSSLVLGTAGNNSSYAAGAANQEYCVPGDSASCAAPVARWDFEERADNTCSGGTNDVCDTSGNGNDGAWNGTGAKHWAAGKVGSAGKFNGSDDFVNNTAYSTTSNQAVSVSAWVKPSSLSNYEGVVSNLDNDSPFPGWVLYVHGDGTVGTYLGSHRMSTATISANAWSHLEFTYDGGTLKLYINGALQRTDNSVTYTGNAGLRLGRFDVDGTVGSSNFFNGLIDNVRIFNYARSAAQVAYDYNRGAPVGYWDFDECQGGTAYDQSGNNNHGTITIGATDENTIGTCTTSSTAWGSGATGKKNASLSFDGDDDYVEITNGSNFNFGNNNFTLAAWVYYTTTPGSTNREYIISHTGADDGGYALATDDLAGGIRFWGNDGSWKNAQATGLVANTWYHFVAVHDGSLNIYVNGVLKQTTEVGTLTNPLTNNFFIGKATNLNYATKYHNGQIDDVKIFNYALTTTQIKNLYNDGAVRFGPVTGSP